MIRSRRCDWLMMINLLQRYMARYEFHASHPLCLSDCEPLSLTVLEIANGECQQW
jgi:hypothetical protein